MPGAKPTGQFAYTPIAIHAIEAAIHVPTKLAPISMPLAAIICGFTKIMYAMVKKVVMPARISLLKSVLKFFNLKIFSSIFSLMVFKN